MPSEAGAVLVVADHAQRLAKRARRDVAQRQQAEHRHDGAELVEMKLRGELEAEDLPPRDAAAQALVAAGEGLPGDDDTVEQHLHRQRDEGEVVRAEAYADCADAKRGKGRDQDREHSGDRQREVGHLHHQSKGVGAEAVEHAVAERDHAGVSDQQVERGCKQRHGAQADDEILEGGAAMEERDRQHHDQGNGGDRHIAQRRVAPHDRRPNRPCGRRSRIAIITM